MSEKRNLNYEKDERVLCYHGPLLYEAKIVRVESKDDRPMYFVHYKGWKQTWDELVPDDRLLKWNDANLQKQQQLRDMHIRRKTPRSSSSRGSSTHDTASESRGRKRQRDATTDKPRTDDDSIWRQEFGLVIPESLKGRLVDDWENVTKNDQLLQLPRNPCITEILNQYRESAKGRTNLDVETLDQVIEGVQLYFSKSLSTSLLYHVERKQHADLSMGEKSVCDIYGIEHLLRLFVQIPSLISHANVDADTLNLLRDAFSDILRFLEEHEKEYFA
ncbi:mrg-domain-containing protein [Lichtheimia corymbifera JMRC:FSU:9682]|uniref:Chromatin modification-related protein EAF3 n=1 Tax=Lichtheimia corymbifera JMRC:FSU:9682 TaxID=1263082 RepID=A0A068RWJ2_9FUNG|nr:mrg-domain-containing protein [Lichtheimia corymbifera JMRC:FSU:9682]